MPSPIDLILDPISIAIIFLYMGLMIWEAAFPATKLPKIKGWIFRGLSSFALFFLLSSYLPLLWDEYLAQYQLFNLSSLSTPVGAVFGLILFELFIYAWHYSMHKSNFLWKIFHQMHHSAERLDTYGAFYFSIMDMIGFTFIGSLCFSLIVGLSPGSITIILLMSNFFSIFQHANIKTPHWLGYIIQRPESHTIHHGRGIHKYNYSDLPFWDIIFGTFKNPESFENKTGFYDGASSRVIDMLLFKDVSNEPTENKENSSSIITIKNQA